MSWQQLFIETGRGEADALSEALEASGAVSVSIEGADNEPLFETDWNDDRPVWHRCRVVALFPEDADIPDALDQVAARLGLADLPSYRVEPLAEQDWVRAWMDRWKPMRFGNNLWVVPSWLTPPEPQAVNITLDPGMAFGTGTHATTGMCLTWLAEHPPREQDVIDFGCGSGILAIAALKLGARNALGTDTDPQALAVTRENAERNGVLDRLTLCLPDAVPPGTRADVVLANILAPALVALAPQLIAITRPGGALLLSGLLHHQADEVRTAYAGAFVFVEQIEDEWALLAGRKRPAAE